MKVTMHVTTWVVAEYNMLQPVLEHLLEAFERTDN